MIESSLLWFFGGLLTFNIATLIYAINIKMYQKKGLSFLQHSKRIIEKNDDQEELKIISEINIPNLKSNISAIRGLQYLNYIAIQANLLLLTIYLLPSLDIFFLILLELSTAGLNAFIVISILAFRHAKAQINAICSGYDLVLQSYEFIKESEEEE